MTMDCKLTPTFSNIWAELCSLKESNDLPVAFKVIVIHNKILEVNSKIDMCSNFEQILT